MEPIRDTKKIEVMKLMFRGSNLRDYCLFVLGINSGLRVTSFTVEHRRSAERTRQSAGSNYNSGKENREIHDFPISSIARKPIEEYLEKRASYLRSEPLFASRKGKYPYTEGASLESIK
ncbi:hypothetical protein [Alicyclobacillus fodiniaquatilis]|uniref:Phage integrase family protein n=1 Tax=Alicyclobacillus fodiniaquatilis TaxID=1661150 RepID=A0ABW4JLY4_9BACL